MSSSNPLAQSLIPAAAWLALAASCGGQPASPAAQPAAVVSSAPPSSSTMPEPQGETICSETCDGRGTPEIVHELQLRGAPVRRCYNRALAIDPTAQGKMRVVVVIGSDGRTCESRVLDSDLPSTMSDCVLDAYR